MRRVWRSPRPSVKKRLVASRSWTRIMACRYFMEAAPVGDGGACGWHYRVLQHTGAAMTRTHRFDTLAAHAGVTPDPASGALSPPLQLATTFEHTPDASTPLGYLYQRYGSPNQTQLEEVLATLDGGARAMFFATGMTAGTTVMQALPPGSE